jgi:hypothetical protein
MHYWVRKRTSGLNLLSMVVCVHRPALDSFGSAYDRIRMGLHSTFPSAFSIGKEKDLS